MKTTIRIPVAKGLENFLSLPYVEVEFEVSTEETTHIVTESFKSAGNVTTDVTNNQLQTFFNPYNWFLPK